MSKKILVIAISVMLLLSFFTGCSKSDMSESLHYPAETSASYDEGGYGKNIAENTNAYFSQSVGKTSAAYDDKRDEQNSDEDSIRKEIKNGDIAVEVEDVEAAYVDIMEIVNNLGGYEFGKNFSTSNNHKKMDLVIKLPPQNLDEFQYRLTE